MKLPSNNLNYPVRIMIGNSSGSGFLISHENCLYLVTAKHVIYQQDNASKQFVPYAEKFKVLCYTFINNQISAEPKIYEANIKILLESNNIKLHDSKDIIIVKMGILNNGVITHSQGIALLQNTDGAVVNYDISGSRKFNDIEITNDVFVFGYPAALSAEEMKQLDYNSPLVRKGIIAGKNNINKTIILDCPAYGGNSGGMALEINEFSLGNYNAHLIGIVVEYVPFIDRWQNTRVPGLFNNSFQNSGYSIVVPVDYIYELIEKFNTIQDGTR